jgi:hypothetical protein
VDYRSHIETPEGKDLKEDLEVNGNKYADDIGSRRSCLYESHLTQSTVSPEGVRSGVLQLLT